MAPARQLLPIDLVVLNEGKLGIGADLDTPLDRLALLTVGEGLGTEGATGPRTFGDLMRLGETPFSPAMGLA